MLGSVVRGPVGASPRPGRTPALSEPIKTSEEVVEADQRATKLEERLVNVVAPLVANREPAILRKAGQRAFHDPPVTPQSLARVDPASGDAWGYAPPSQGFSTTREVVSLVGVELVGTLPRSAGTTTRPLDRLDAIHSLIQDLRVVDVCGGEHYRQWDASSVRNKVALRARFSLIRRIRSGFRAPLLAGMLAESREACSQSIRSASPRRSSKMRCSLSHTRASCHSRKRRQQVIPEPQPISWGSISQGMPLLSTKTMHVRAARSSMRVLPPRGFGGSGGRSGPMVSHGSSVTSSLATLSGYPINGFVRLTKWGQGPRRESGPVSQIETFGTFCSMVGLRAKVLGRLGRKPSPHPRACALSCPLPESRS
jgi:hypothetical protein